MKSKKKQMHELVRSRSPSAFSVQEKIQQSKDKQAQAQQIGRKRPYRKESTS